jgi:hypothetical protein
MARVKLRELNPTGSLQITGSVGITGSFQVETDQSVVFTQHTPGVPALIISGAAEIVQAQLQSQIVSASLSIQNLGTLSDPSSGANIDLGGFY